MQPTRLATAMCANDFRLSSQAFHSFAFWPIAKMNLSTGRLCQ